MIRHDLEKKTNLFGHLFDFEKNYFSLSFWTSTHRGTK